MSWQIDSRIAADSTMLRMVNLLIALSFGVQREQLEQLFDRQYNSLHLFSSAHRNYRIGLTCPRPFLFRPFDARFLTMIAVYGGCRIGVVSRNRVGCSEGISKWRRWIFESAKVKRDPLTLARLKAHELRFSQPPSNLHLQ